jgi:hypothetical protein
MYRNSPSVLSALSESVLNMQVKGHQDESPIRSVGKKLYITPNFDQNRPENLSGMVDEDDLLHPL